MSSSDKQEKALEHIRLAEKHLKTSFLRWKPDYESAADEYNKAATCFRNTKSWAQCRDALLKSVECHKQNGALFSAAKCLDQTILISKEMQNYEDISQIAKRAANMYQSHGSADTAAQSLDKAAKILESKIPTEALALFEYAAEIAQIQDSSRQVAEYLNKVARLQVKLSLFDEASDTIQREIAIHREHGTLQAAGRLVVALILVRIAAGDIVDATKTFDKYNFLCEAQEVVTLHRLLTAYDENDRQEASRALNDPFIKHMDVEYAILAQRIPLPVAIDEAPSAEQGNADNAGDDVDMERGALC